MSLLDIIPGGSYLSTKISSGAAIVKGEAGKVYYGAQGAVYDAIGGTAKVAEKVAIGVRNYTLYAAIAIGFVVLWPFIAPLLANAFQKRSA